MQSLTTLVRRERSRASKVKSNGGCSLNHCRRLVERDCELGAHHDAGARVRHKLGGHIDVPEAGTHRSYAPAVADWHAVGHSHRAEPQLSSAHRRVGRDEKNLSPLELTLSYTSRVELEKDRKLIKTILESIRYICD
eukprot:scaffold323314_cov30-Tisochrysis_lutea.AAC.3